MKRYKKSALAGIALFAAAFLVLGLAGTAMAIHPDIQLRDAGNVLIPATGLGDLQPAFSVRNTCGACHDGVTSGGDGLPLLSYDEIEKHSFHAQMGANQMVGWGAWNPDSGSKYLKGPAAKGKNWVQSPGHFGKW